MTEFGSSTLTHPRPPASKRPKRDDSIPGRQPRGDRTALTPWNTAMPAHTGPLEAQWAAENATPTSNDVDTESTGTPPRQEAVPPA